MVASRKTVEHVREIILNHLDRAKAQALVADLQSVKGNKSFEDTIDILEEALRREG